MDRELTKLTHEGELEPLQAWMAEQKKRPPVSDLLWCALFSEDEACQRFLVDVATKKKITPKKKGWPWNDAHAAAIVGDVEGLQRAIKRGADFEALAVPGTALTTAIRLRHIDFIKALIEHGVDTTTEVKMAPLGKRHPNFTTLMMIKATPLGVALRDACEETVEVLLEHIKVEPVHLGDAVHGGSTTLIHKICDTLGGAAPLEPKLFWSVHDPAVIPVLAERGLDLTALPTDTGTWGGSIWSYWGYYLKGETRLDAFQKFFAAGMRGTAQALGDVIQANIQGIESTEMVDAFLEGGADLADEVTWEGERWDEKNDCQMMEKGSVAEMRMAEGRLEVLQYLQQKGAPIRPTRPDPTWRDAEEKKAWLERLGVVKELSVRDFVWLRTPGAEEIRKFIATSDGLVGLKLRAEREDLEDEWDLDRAESGGESFQLEFDADDELERVSLEFEDLGSGEEAALMEALTEAFGKAKGRGKRKTWAIPKGKVSLYADVNEYYCRHTIDMSTDA
ncbi:MAG: ankyrin repeat domain-containing protein [Myxococcota bacterium]